MPPCLPRCPTTCGRWRTDLKRWGWPSELFVPKPRRPSPKRIFTPRPPARSGRTSGRRPASARRNPPPPIGTIRRSRRPSIGTGRTRRREQGERHIAEVSDALGIARAKLALITEQLALPIGNGAELAQELKSATDALARAAEANRSLKSLSKPFLNWAGKAERLSFDVPTLPLFVHERLSTKAIIDTLTGHKRDQQLALFADPQRSIADQVLKAYEHRDKWVNRMILGDSLVVMNSLLHYESLGGQVQMIYIDPPYGIKFGSNFQPFVRKRDVSHGDDEDMTREPEMVQAYRDTWEMGLHSYLTYMRDRLLLSHQLLASTGSVFVQISEANVHHVRELLDDIFGSENFQAQVNFKSTSALGAKGLAKAYDYILWYSRDHDAMKFRPIYKPREIADDREWRFIDDQTAAGGYRKLTEEQFRATQLLRAVSSIEAYVIGVHSVLYVRIRTGR